MFKEFIQMGYAGGSLMDHVAKHVTKMVDVGPIADIRAQFAVRAWVEKEVMKLQNA